MFACSAKPDCSSLRFPRIGGGSFILELLDGLRVLTGTLQDYCCRNNNSLLLESLHCLCQSHSPELKGLLAAELDLVLQTADSAYDKVRIPGPGTQCWFVFILFQRCVEDLEA